MDKLEILQETLMKELSKSSPVIGELPSQPMVMRKERHSSHKKSYSTSQLSVLNSPPTFRLPRGNRPSNVHQRFNSFDQYPDELHAYNDSRRSSTFSTLSSNSQLMTPKSSDSLHFDSPFPNLTQPLFSAPVLHSEYQQPVLNHEFSFSALPVPTFPAAYNFEEQSGLKMETDSVKLAIDTTNRHETFVDSTLTQPLGNLDLVEGEENEDVKESHVCLWANCNIEFSDIDELVNHISIDHVGSGQNSYVCRWKGCSRDSRPFTKRHKIQNHIRIHTGERPFVCDIGDCGKRFSRQDGLNTHMKTHSTVKPFICNYQGCTKAYFHARSLKKHEKTHVDPVFTKGNLGNYDYGMSVMTPMSATSFNGNLQTEGTYPQYVTQSYLSQDVNQSYDPWHVRPL